MIVKINHVGIAVNSIDKAVKLYADVLGLKVKDIEVVADQKVKTAIIPVGESKIELLESTDPEGAIAKYPEKRGEGIHHIAFAVENIEEKLKNIEQKGVRLIDQNSRKGAEGLSIAFLHPKSTFSVLTELCEDKS
ncbi:MAG: methylmalonyl-CoA epimerase [Candidatus Heimdallarchaeota archaeon]|nr:methylmalonyl-CoA epimerase [Candidatus Heimdallarchaeota archaeon]